MGDLFENPVKYLIISVFILMFVSLLFKFLNWLETLSGKNKATEKKDKEESKEEKKSTEEEKYTGDKTSNYLYDRFVENPTSVDNNKVDSCCEAFITEDEFTEIKNNKVHIEVKSDTNISESNFSSEIDELQKNRLEKEKLLDEFNTLSREMKLLLIENILQKKE